MAGFYNRTTEDSCWEKYQDEVNERQYDYTLTRNAVMRENRVEAPFLTAGLAPDFFGPKVGDRVTRESFLQGRGHTLSKCADCDVVYLPESLFPAHTTKTKCDRVDLEGLYTRVPKSCNGLMETNVTAYRMMPENWKKGYAGYNAVVYSNLQSRVGPPEKQKSYNPCAQSYSDYTTSRDMSRYAF